MKTFERMIIAKLKGGTVTEDPQLLKRIKSTVLDAKPYTGDS